ncbi:TPA: hypothetical protein N0F65_003914 [Lagenidium giganteum]|uniref:N-acetyltransferase domain-containing protein n=1 Tax=Lagenidium giganteum TaxID=4803 RepID=A0AAV2ZCZ0_9STRA|nr:TPA: hypothetical protein N0F65_003914 [Lagenidium giganteum]
MASPTSSLAATSVSAAAAAAPFHLVPLAGAPDVVHGVRKLNLGALPVQCPAVCYTRAEQDADALQLSWAAVTPQGKVIGGVLAELEGNVVVIRTLAVDSGWRQRSVGRRLIEQVQHQTRQLMAAIASDNDEGSKQGHDDDNSTARAPNMRLPSRTLTPGASVSLQLHVHVGNTDAQAFYERIGFAQTARLTNYYRRLEPRDCFVYSLEL